MKILLIVISVLFVGCSLPTQPSLVIYIPRNDLLAKSVVEQAIAIANLNDMTHITVDEDLFSNDYEEIFAATNSGWLHRSLSIGYPKGGAFSIQLMPKEIYISLSHVEGVGGVQTLKKQWLGYLRKSNIDYQIEDQHQLNR